MIESPYSDVLISGSDTSQQAAGFDTLGCRCASISECMVLAMLKFILGSGSS